MPPEQEKGYAPLEARVVRVWEPAPPKGVKEPLEWILLTSLETDRADEAWERVAHYTCRWTNQEYHSCLKTGCTLEKRNLGDQPALERLLAICGHRTAPTARPGADRARAASSEVVEPELVAVVAAVSELPGQGMTIQALCTAVARRGGYLGRKGDGPPGWKTLWRGWYDIQRILEGVRLARHLTSS